MKKKMKPDYEDPDLNIARSPVDKNVTLSASWAETGAELTNPPNPKPICILPNTADRVRRIQASLASSIRAEFASVTGQLNASQRNSKRNSNNS